MFFTSNIKNSCSKLLCKKGFNQILLHIISHHNLFAPLQSFRATSYMDTSFIRNSTTPKGHHRALGIVLLQGPRVGSFVDGKLYHECPEKALELKTVTHFRGAVRLP